MSGSDLLREAGRRNAFTAVQDGFSQPGQQSSEPSPSHNSSPIRESIPPATTLEEEHPSSQHQTTDPNGEQAETLPLPGLRPPFFRPTVPAAQDACLFLARLPYDVRVSVYEELFGRRRVHVVSEYSASRGGWRSYNFVCAQNGHAGKQSCNEGYALGQVPQETEPMRRKWATLSCYHMYKFGEPWVPRLGCAAMLRTCKMIYNEAIHVLYASNTFCLDRPCTVRSLRLIIAPANLANIRTVSVLWNVSEIWDLRKTQTHYSEIFLALSKLPGLTTLLVSIVTQSNARLFTGIEGTILNLQERVGEHNLDPLDCLQALPLKTFHLGLPPAIATSIQNLLQPGTRWMFREGLDFKVKSIRPGGRWMTELAVAGGVAIGATMLRSVPTRSLTRREYSCLRTCIGCQALNQSQLDKPDL